jgi:hypothetical protein
MLGGITKDPFFNNRAENDCCVSPGCNARRWGFTVKLSRKESRYSVRSKMDRYDLANNVQSVWNVAS